MRCAFLARFVRVVPPSSETASESTTSPPGFVAVLITSSARFAR
jgi:hypothetical protein